MINADRLGKRAGTRSDAEFAAEEARLLDELLASADLSSPTTPEIRSGDQTSDAETPHRQLTWPGAGGGPPTASGTDGDSCAIRVRRTGVCPHIHGYDDQCRRARRARRTASSLDPRRYRARRRGAEAG